jgi:cytochrome P450 family 6
MIAIVKKTIEHREKNNVQRKDFMQLLLQLRNTGTVGADGEWQVKTTSGECELFH